MSLTVDYFEIILIAFPIIILTQSIGNAVRAEGNANVAMTTIFIGTVVNIGLEPLFIFGLSMGICGAAIAMLISISVTGLGPAIYFLSGRSEMAFGRRFLRYYQKLIKEIPAVGASGFVFVLLFSASDFLTLMITLLFVYRVMKSIPNSSSASIQAGNEAR